ncbi:MAG: hypothetical protein H7326_04870 [Bdellovibrionaceae bacterium]|nr:hypothetical protein [Pseudobdellovibrionaceae bacterium]
MKSFIWILAALTLNLSACAKGGRSVSARDDGRAKDEKIGNANVGGNGAFTAPENSETVKMGTTQPANLTLKIQKQSVATGFLCVDDLISKKSLVENDAIKVLAGSQIIAAQDTQVKPTESPLKRKGKVAQVRPVANIMCVQTTSTPANQIAANLELDETIQRVRMETGSSQLLTMNLGAGGKSNFKAVVVGCVVKEKIIESAKALSEFNAEGVDILMVEGSAMQFLTNNVNDAPLRFTLGCGAKKAEAATVAVPPAPPTPEAPGL